MEKNQMASYVSLSSQLTGVVVKISSGGVPGKTWGPHCHAILTHLSEPLPSMAH